MLLILLSWIYITFTCVNFGMMINKILKFDSKDFAITVVLGLFGITLITEFWAVFFRVNWEFHMALFLLNITILISFKNSIIKCYKQFWTELKSHAPFFKILLSLITILIIAQSSSSPYIIDNETYYIQSVKWLNEYGFVDGLANLHPFLAQMSGWHVAQSAFSFSFLYDRFNDLSGFCLLIGNIFAITKINAYFQNRNGLYRGVGLLPLANVFLFQFISAPSPDLPIYIFTIIIVFYFIKNYKIVSGDAFKIMSLLAALCFYIKPTSAFLLGFPLIYFTKHFFQLKKNLPSITIIGLLTLAAFFTKNTIISGYPLFPYTGISVDADYTLPRELADFYIDITRRYAFHLSSDQFKQISPWELFLHWLTLPGLHGFFNKIAVALMIISPLLIYRFYNKKSVWIIYIIMCVQLVFLYISSPQYRFFFNFSLVFTLLFTGLIINRKSIVILLTTAGTIVTAILLFVPVNFSFLTKNKLMNDKGTFSVSTIIFPASNSKTEALYVEKHEANLNYYSPANAQNFWINGNAPLPAVSREQLEYFRRKFGIVPQLRTESLSDGFYSKHVAE